MSKTSSLLICGAIVFAALAAAGHLSSLVVAGVYNLTNLEITRIVARHPESPIHSNPVCIENGKAQSLIAILTWTLELTGPRAGTLAMLGRLEEQQGCIAQAIQWLDDGSELQPTRPTIASPTRGGEPRRSPFPHREGG